MSKPRLGRRERQHAKAIAARRYREDFETIPSGNYAKSSLNPHGKPRLRWEYRGTHATRINSGR